MSRPEKAGSRQKNRSKLAVQRPAKRETSRAGRGKPPTQPASPQTLRAAPQTERPTHRWTFLTNHAHVLILIKAQPELILREVAARVGITERAVQRIIQDLESAGFIQRQKVGRQNQYLVLTEQPLRHPIEAHRTIGDLIKLING